MDEISPQGYGFFIAKVTCGVVCNVNSGTDDWQESKEALPRTRALWQGDPSAPHLFNATLDVIAVRFCKIAKRRVFGDGLIRSVIG